MAALIKSSLTGSQGSPKPNNTVALISNTITGLMNSPSTLSATSNPSPYKDSMGFGGSDYGTVPWAGDGNNGAGSIGIIVGVMGVF